MEPVIIIAKRSISTFVQNTYCCLKNVFHSSNYWQKGAKSWWFQTPQPRVFSRTIKREKWFSRRLLAKLPKHEVGKPWIVDESNWGVSFHTIFVPNKKGGRLGQHWKAFLRLKLISKSSTFLNTEWENVGVWEESSFFIKRSRDEAIILIQEEENSNIYIIIFMTHQLLDIRRMLSLSQVSSSTLGSQKAMFLQDEDIIIYFGLNWTHWTGPVWSPLKTQTLVPFSAFQMWTRPSVEPEMTNWLSGENDASRGIFLEFRWPVKVCMLVPENASIKRIMLPLVEMRMVLPSGLNLRPVHSMSFSTAKWTSWNVPIFFS